MNARTSRIAGLVLSFFAVSVRAAPVPVTNPGFELDVAVPGNFLVVNPAPEGWTRHDPFAILDGGGDALGVIAPSGTTFYVGPMPEGNQAGIVYLGGDSGTGQEAGLAQTLAVTVASNTVYTLSVSVGNIASGTGLPPSDQFGFFNLDGFPGYRVELRGGTNLLAVDHNTLGGDIPEGAFRGVEIGARIGGHHPAIGQPLGIRLVNLNLPGTPAEPGIEVNFDDVRLDASPLISGTRHALCFFGTGTGRTDRVKIPIDPDTPLDVGGDFTIEFWLRAEAADNAGTVSPGMNGDGWITGNVVVDRDIYGPGDFGDFGIAIGAHTGPVVAAFGVHNGTWGETLVGTREVADGLWRHIAVTRESDTGAMRLFVDGIPDGEMAGPTGMVSYRDGRATSFPDSDPFLVFGAEKHDAGSAYPSLAGCLDEVRIWSRVLTTNELVRVSRGVVDPGRETGLVGYWRFEEGAGMVLADSSLTAATGTVIAGVAGNGEWVAGSAPVDAHEPILGAPVASAAPAATWFAQRHFRYDLEALTDPMGSNWIPVAGATNLPGADLPLTAAGEAPGSSQAFLRVVGWSEF